MMWARSLFFIGLYLCTSVSAAAQITTYQLSLKDSTQNILYVGIPNKIAINNLPAHANVKFEDKYIAPVGKNYIINPNKPGNYKLSIYDKNKKTIFSKEYIVNHLNNPRIQLGIVKYQIASVSDILVNPSLEVYSPDCQLKASWRIVNYTIAMLTNGVYESKTVSGDNLTNVPFDQDIQRRIAGMKNRDRIFIEGIKAYGPDDKMRNLNVKIISIGNFDTTDIMLPIHDNIKLRKEVRVIVYRMTDCHTINKESGLLEWLQGVAADSELIQLTDHENVVVKNFAFIALTSRKGVDIFPILLKHINDTTRVSSMSADVVTSWQTNVIFLSEVYQNGKNPETYKLTQSQTAIIDSILLFGDSLRFGWVREYFLRRTKPDLKYYSRIRELALSGNLPVLVLLLAKFKNKNDIELIKKLFEKDEYYIVRSVREFPHKSFYPLLKTEFEKYLAGYEPYNYVNEWRILCEAIAQYPSKETYQLFEKLMLLKSKSEYEYERINDHERIMQHLFVAIHKYPNPIFEPLNKKIKLDERTRDQLIEEVKNETW